MVAVLGGIQVVDQGVGQLGEDRAQIGAGPAGGLVVRVLDGREGAGVPVEELVVAGLQRGIGDLEAGISLGVAVLVVDVLGVGPAQAPGVGGGGGVLGEGVEVAPGLHLGTGKIPGPGGVLQIIPVGIHHHVGRDAEIHMRRPPCSRSLL